MAVTRSRGRNLNVILAERRARRLSRFRSVGVGVLIAIAVVLLVRALLEQRGNPAFERYRLVVVPFENRTGDAALDTIGLVASDWITRVLSGYARQREVVPTTTALAYMHSARLARHDLFTRAMQLAAGTRSQIVVWGTYYQTGDTLRFTYEIHDLATSLMVGTAPPQIVVPLYDVMSGVDRLRNSVVRQVLRTESYNRPRPRPVPNLPAYQAFVGGLDDYVNRRFAQAARHFAHSAAQDTISYLPHQIWLLDALIEGRQFAQADSASKRLRGRKVTRADEARAMRAFARLRTDNNQQYAWASALAQQNGANDLARYEWGLASLATAAPRGARRIFGELHPNSGLLHGRPDFYLHHAAAYHLIDNHQEELRVVRAGLLARHRSLDVRLANCRVRAALGDEGRASAALNAIVARDTDTISTLTVGDALDDCAAELSAHGLVMLAGRAERLSHDWHARHPRVTVVRDSIYERPYLQLERARALARSGNAAGALNLLYDAMSNGLPYYEPGRVMLHADPAFRSLRNTRGFRRINQTRG